MPPSEQNGIGVPRLLPQFQCLPPPASSSNAGHKSALFKPQQHSKNKRELPNSSEGAATHCLLLQPTRQPYHPSSTTAFFHSTPNISLTVQLIHPFYTSSWEQRKFEEIAVRSSVICSDDTLPRVEYEDIVSGAGRLNKDIYAKQSSKSGIAFHQGDVLYGKLRPYLQNWLLPTFDGLAVGDFWVLQPQNADSSFLYRLIQSRQFDEVANQSTGTKMPRADWKLVSKTVFSIPSNISEQAAIGTYFTALDSLITLHQRKGKAAVSGCFLNCSSIEKVRRKAEL